jgi:hypothetical protein
MAQADGISRLDEGALLAALDEREPAWSAEQEIRRRRTDAVVGIGARKENEARLAGR